MKTILILLLTIIISGAVLIGGYTGKIPAVAKVLGASHAKNLGVDYASIDEKQIYSDIGTEVVDNSSEAGPTGIKLEGKKELNHEFSQEEITALANTSPFKHFPFKDVQVRINSDGSVEASAILKVEVLFNLANAMGYSSDEVREQMEKYNVPIKDLPVYGKGTGYVKDNKITADLSKVSVSGIPLPGFIVEKATPQIITATEGLIESFPGFEAKSITFSDGKANFEGTVPEKQFYE